MLMHQLAGQVQTAQAWHLLHGMTIALTEAIERADGGRSGWPQRTLSAADIPGFSMSSGAGHVVAPGGCFVVASVGLQAAVEDPDEAVGDLAQGGLVADLAGAELSVVGGGAG